MRKKLKLEFKLEGTHDHFFYGYRDDNGSHFGKHITLLHTLSLRQPPYNQTDWKYVYFWDPLFTSVWLKRREPFKFKCHNKVYENNNYIRRDTKETSIAK